MQRIPYIGHINIIDMLNHCWKNILAPDYLDESTQSLKRYFYLNTTLLLDLSDHGMVLRLPKVYERM